MGVDISGKNPIVRSPKPQMDWDKDPSQEERMAFWDVLGDWEKENPGDYFRSNWWGWRPIVMLCETASEKFDLGIDFSLWGSNDGSGLDTQVECNELADALDEITHDFFETSDVDELQLCLGSWTTTSGKFLDKEIQDELNEQYPFGTILNTSIVLDDGTLVQSGHSVHKLHVKRFISFLRECGGFEIW